MILDIGVFWPEVLPTARVFNFRDSLPGESFSDGSIRTGSRSVLPGPLWCNSCCMKWIDTALSPERNEKMPSVDPLQPDAHDCKMMIGQAASRVPTVLTGSIDRCVP